MSPGIHAAPKRPRTVPDANGETGRPIVFNYVPALDGLRAVAVLGVLLYHGGAPLVTGGFLGVDVFFVLSGFLITSLLLGEWTERMTIKLGQFWARRARRLLPALLVMLVGVALYAKVFAQPGEFANLRLDSLSTLFYVANWHFIVGGNDYFALNAPPSPLQHMWTLSIEEQFYFVWPLVVLFLLRVGRRLRPARRLWPVLAAAVVGAIASAIDMRLSYQGGASVMRLYEGTDTRSQDVLVGAALAAGMAIWAQRRKQPAIVDPRSRRAQITRVHPSAGTVGTAAPPGHRRDRPRQRALGINPIAAWEIIRPRARAVLQVVGWTVLALGAYCLWRLTGPRGFLFEGGYFLFALGVAMVIFCVVTAQAASLSRALGNRVFRFVGMISYGTYLWHVPLFALLSSLRLHLYGYPLLAVRIAATLVVATGSYYLVEEPVRKGRLRSFSEWRVWLLTSASFVGVVAVTVAATLPSTAEAAGSLRVEGAQYTGPPVKVLILGDSVAYTMGFAMLAGQPQNSYDVSIDNGALIGCGFLRSTGFRQVGVDDQVATSCNTTSPTSEQWPALWQGDLNQFHPNVVVVMAGRWEVSDRTIDGHWLHIGQPAFDAALKRSMEQAVQVATSSGALLVFMTSPCFAPSEQPNGQLWPETSLTRVASYNTMVRTVATEHPATVQVDELGAQLCPGGQYTATLNGLQIRDGDGVHIVPTAAAGQWVDARVLPDVVRLGRLQMAGRQLVSTSSSSTSTASSTATGAGP